MATHDDSPNRSDRTALACATDGRRSGSETPSTTTPLPTTDLELRTINIEQIASAIRRCIDLSADGIAPGLTVAKHRRSRGSLIRFEDVDADGWLAWVIAGVYLFSGGPPSMKEVRREAKRIALCLAMFRGRGSLSKAAAALGMSRKVLRDNLRVAELYPWVGQQRPPQRRPTDLEQHDVSTARPDAGRQATCPRPSHEVQEAARGNCQTGAAGTQVAGDGFNDASVASRDNTLTSASTRSRDATSRPASHTWTDPA